MVDNPCTDENLIQILKSLKEALTELKKIGSVNTTTIGEKLKNINSSIDWLCLTYLGFNNQSASFLANQLRPAAAQMSGHKVTGTAKKCVPHIENLIDYLENEYFDDEDENYEEESGEESEYSDTNQQTGTLFPNNKYLNLSDPSQFPDVKSKYKQLSLIYHPDKCPNDKTTGMTKQQCETEFKILNSEYNNIKERFGISGGKRKTRKSIIKTKKRSKLIRKQYKSKSRKNKKSKRIYRR
jgi:hypothetical protein